MTLSKQPNPCWVVWWQMPAHCFTPHIIHETVQFCVANNAFQTLNLRYFDFLNKSPQTKSHKSNCRLRVVVKTALCFAARIPGGVQRDFVPR